MADAIETSAVAAGTRLRSLVTYVDDTPGSERRLAAAVALARLQDAHLSVVAFGYDPNIPPYAFGAGAGVGLPSLGTMLARIRETAEARAEAAEAAIARGGVRGDVVVRVVTYAAVSSAFAEHARFADLCVVDRPYDEDGRSTAVDALEGALFEGDAAALVCPPKARVPDAGKAVIGWDASREALRAVRRALPLLRRAASVEIAMIEPARDTDAPGEDLATMLSRHDVAVEIAALPTPSGTIAEALAQRALETGAELLVLGAYGHSRFREAVIGGVTRDTLERTRVAVLMAH
ncbi:MAG: universal stress protein [Paracoccaceae bacterium]